MNEKEYTIAESGLVRTRISSLVRRMEDKTLVLVDDVVFTGRTLLKASGYLLSMGAEQVLTAALCDRDMREAPLRADFVGFHLDVGPNNVIDVHIPPYEEDLGIVVTPRPRAAS